MLIINAFLYALLDAGTSLSLAPSGNFLWAGFSDGTLRVFDLTGHFGLEQDLAVASRQKSTMLVASKWCQTFGAVACQIHARGVHTDLLTQVDVCDDYVFCGVNRGAMDLYAVSTSDLEANADHPQKQNILDYLQVHVHADAKLKGLGACTKLRTAGRPTYLLLTGKGIKNIHIWSFQPPLAGEEDPIWTQLYDTQTNGNTINLLGFYRSPKTNKLLGISKSDAQKLRLWDLSAEEDENSDKNEEDDRPKRPPYVDVANSKAALGLAAGGFCVCGGPTMYNQLSIVSLDQPQNAYNHTELALPSTGDIKSGMGSRRQRRGDLKQVVNVASPPPGDINEGQMLLELDDGSIVQYTMSFKGGSRLQVLQPPTLPALPDDYWKRTICLASSKSTTSLVVAMCLYNPNTQKGQLVIRSLAGAEPSPPSPTQADNSALQALCMQAPPSSALKRSKKERKKHKRALAEALKKKERSSESTSLESSLAAKKKKSSPIMTHNISSDYPVLQPKKKKRKKPTDVVTRVQGTPVLSKKQQSTSASTVERIRVNKLKVIPLSSNKNTQKQKVSGLETPVAGVNETSEYIRVKKLQVIPMSMQEHEEKQPAGFETPIGAFKEPSRSKISTTLSNKLETLVQQVSPESASSKQPAKVIQKQQQKAPQDKLAYPPVPKKVPKKPRNDGYATPRKETSEKLAKKKILVVDSSLASRTKMVAGKKRSRTPPVPSTNLEKKVQSENLARKKFVVVDSNLTAETMVAGKKRPRTPPVPSATLEKKQQDLEIASILVDMKSPSAKKKAVTPDGGQSRQELIAIRLRTQFKRIQGHLKDLPPFQPSFLRKPSPRPKSLEEAQAFARSKLFAAHRASHELIRKRMLRAAESTIRNAMDSYLSIEEARNELKSTVKSYHEVVHDTLQRQKLEASALSAQQTRGRSGLDVPTAQVSFPFQSVFRDLEEIRVGIEAPRRPPGRPRSL